MDHLRVRPCIQQARLLGAHVEGQHADAVGIVALEIGFDDIRRCAQGVQDRAPAAAQRCGLDEQGPGTSR